MTESIHYIKLPAQLRKKFEELAKGQPLNAFLADLLAKVPLEPEPTTAGDVLALPPSFDPRRGHFVPSGFDWKWTATLERAVLRTNTLVIADHGLGKTFSIFKMAEKHKALVWYFAASYGLERGVLEGQYYPRPNGHPIQIQDPDGKWHVLVPPVTLQAIDGFITSVITASQDHKAWLVIDEFFFLPKDVEPNLFAAMDTHQGIYSIAYRGAAVRVNPNFRVIASTNPPSPLYPEAETSNRALLSRFGAVLRIPYPDQTELGRFLGYLAQKVAPEKQKILKDLSPRLVRFALQVRQAQEKGELDNFVSPRDLKQFVDAVRDGLPAEEALDETVFPKFGARYIEGVKKFWQLAAGAS